MLKTIIAASLFVMSASASAGVISHSDSVEYTDTDFSQLVMSFDKFDDNGGTYILDSVKLSLTGELFGTAKVENFSNSGGSTIEANLAALLELTTLSGDDLIAALPSVTRSFDASVFDGDADWAGTSGMTFENLMASNTSYITLTDESMLALFTGTGAMTTYLSGSADSSVTGGGNIFSGFESQARGNITVTYNFTDTTKPDSEVTVPVPASLSILALGLLGFGARRKKS